MTPRDASELLDELIQRHTANGYETEPRVPVSVLRAIRLALAHYDGRFGKKPFYPLPFSMDQRAQAAVLADLPPSVAQEAGEFYENANAGRPRGTMLKREAMAVAWQSVLRPYLIGLRDHSDTQHRPEQTENAVLKKALRDIADGTCLVFDESEEREVQVWMDAEDLQEIAQKALAEVDASGGGGR